MTFSPTTILCVILYTWHLGGWFFCQENSMGKGLTPIYHGYSPDWFPRRFTGLTKRIPNIQFKVILTRTSSLTLGVIKKDGNIKSQKTTNFVRFWSTSKAVSVTTSAFPFFNIMLISLGAGAFNKLLTISFSMYLAAFVLSFFLWEE